MTPRQFAKELPFPPDAMLSAVEDAIVSFFPTGRHSHVREVLASYTSMAAKTDTLTTDKMRSVMDDPRVMKALNMKVDQELNQAMESLTSSPAGT